jgi:hypothetical protein
MYYTTHYPTGWEKEMLGTHYQCGKKSMLFHGTELGTKYEASGGNGDEDDETLEKKLE